MVRIPVEYQEVEYLESTGTQYIDSEVSVTDQEATEYKVIFTSQTVSVRTGGTNIGCCFEKSGLGGTWVGVSNGGVVTIGGGNNFAESPYVISKKIVVFGNNKITATIGGETKSRNKGSGAVHTARFFASDTSTYSSKMRLYSAKIYKSDNLIRNLIPCYRKSDNEPGMYDAVSGTFFTNAGTGEFVVGNDVSWDTASLIERRRQILLSTPHLETISDTMASFKTDVPAPVKDCKVYFSPIQDLHGYDSPWPAGGGVNVIPYAVAKTETVGGLTFSTDGKGAYTVTGTPTDIGYVYFDLIEPFTIPDGSVNKIYFLNNIVYSSVRVDFMNGTSVIDTWSINTANRSANYSRMSNKYCTAIKLRCTNLNRTDPFELTLKIIIVPNETVVTGYIPYENICPITGWDGVTITRCGKNLFGVSDATNIQSGTNKTLSVSDGLINILATAGVTATTVITESAMNKIAITKTLPAGTYVFSVANLLTTVSGLTESLFVLNLSNGIVVANGESFSIAEETGISSINLSQRWTYAKDNYVKFNIQIEQGSTATSYAPYTGTSITVPFPQTIYGGYVDLVKGEVVETDYLLTVDENTVPYNVRRNTGGRVVGYYNLPYAGIKDAFTYYSHGQCIKSTTATYNYQAAGCVANQPYNSDAVQAAISASSDITTVEQYPDWIASVEPLQITYELATPITHQLTPQVIKTLRGINNIWSNANGNISIQYYTH